MRVTSSISTRRHTKDIGITITGSKLAPLTLDVAIAWSEDTLRDGRLTGRSLGGREKSLDAQGKEAAGEIKAGASEVKAGAKDLAEQAKGKAGELKDKVAR